MGRWKTLGQRLTRVLGVRAGEHRTIGQLVLIFGLTEAGRGFGMNASDALFFVRFGVDKLPWMYIALGGLTFLAVVLYAAGVARYRWGFLQLLFPLIVIILVLERLLVPFGWPAIYPAIWLSVQVFSWVLVTASWNLASESFDTRQAKRLFSLLASASILGSVVGHSLTSWLAGVVGTENLLVAYALILGPAFLAVRSITRDIGSGSQPTRRETTTAGVRVGFQALRSSPLLRLIAAASILFSILFFSVWFPFNRAVSGAFPDEAGVASFLGRFTSIVMLSTLALSLLSNRIYSRLGVVNAVLIVPLIYLAGFGLWMADFSLATAAVVRFLQMVWINGAGWSAWNALFNVFHSDSREQLRTFEAGIPAQIGTSASGLFLLLGDRVLSTSQIFLMGAVAASALAVVCWRMRPAYGQALLAAIRAGLVDVFTGSSESKGPLATDGQARASLVAALHGGDVGVRRVAAELLGRVPASEAIPALVKALEDEADSVREAAVIALASAGDMHQVANLRPLLRDQSSAVRVQAVRAIAELDGDSESLLARAGTDDDPSVRAECAAQLFKHGHQEAARRILLEMLNSSGSEAHRAALRASANASIELPLDRIRVVLDTAPVDVRVLGAQAMARCDPESVASDILDLLVDLDPRVRQSAALAARKLAIDTGRLFAILEDADHASQLSALEAMDFSEEVSRERLIRWVSGLVHELERTRGLLDGVETELTKANGAALRFVRDQLKRRTQDLSQLVLKALRPLVSRRAMQIIQRGLQSEDRLMRGHALEALETLGEQNVVNDLVRLLEGDQSPRKGAPMDELIGQLGKDQDPWIRAFSARIQADRLSVQIQALKAQIESDEAVIVKELWADGFMFEGVSMTETLDTISTFDRIIILRQIPIFDDLDADDLHQIAQIAIERYIPEGGYLCREGELENELFLIVDGKVSVTKRHNGGQKELRRVGPGQPVGELAILASLPRSATVRAVDGGVRALVIRGEEFQSILRDRPSVGKALLASLARRLGSVV